MGPQLACWSPLRTCALQIPVLATDSERATAYWKHPLSQLGLTVSCTPGLGAPWPGTPTVRAASGHEGAKLPLLLLDSLAHARSTDWRPPVSGAPNDGQCLCSELGRKRKSSHGCPADGVGEAGGPPAVRTVQPAARAPCADDKRRQTSTEQQRPRRAGCSPGDWMRALKRVRAGHQAPC